MGQRQVGRGWGVRKGAGPGHHNHPSPVELRVGRNESKICRFISHSAASCRHAENSTHFFLPVFAFIYLFLLFCGTRKMRPPAGPSLPKKKSPCENLANRLRTERKTRRKKERRLLFSSLFLFSSFFSQAFAFKAACGGVGLGG